MKKSSSCQWSSHIQFSISIPSCSKQEVIFPQHTSNHTSHGFAYKVQPRTKNVNNGPSSTDCTTDMLCNVPRNCFFTVTIIFMCILFTYIDLLSFSLRHKVQIPHHARNHLGYKVVPQVHPQEAQCWTKSLGSHSFVRPPAGWVRSISPDQTRSGSPTQMHLLMPKMRVYVE